jgi:hypothetical protein
MSDRPWWSHTLQWGIWALVMTLVMGWLARARRPAAVAKGARVLTHPPTTLIVGIVCTGFFVVVAILAGIYASAKDWWTPYAFAAFVLLGAPLIVEGVRVRHELTDEGIVYQGFWTRYAMVSWAEVESAHWSTSMKWLTLTTRDRRVLRFSGMLNGLDSLALALKERTPRLHSDDATAKVLADACQGTLPSIWM